jgi:CheY-like chemotaxis protein
MAENLLLNPNSFAGRALTGGATQRDGTKMNEGLSERPWCRRPERVHSSEVLARLRCLGSLILLGVFVCCFQSGRASDAGGIQNEKNPESRYHIPPLLKADELRKKPGEYDPHAAIGDPEAAERELENLNNTVSNAMQLASQTHRAEEASGGLFKSVVIAAALLGGGIFVFRKLAPKIASYLQSRFGIWRTESDGADASTQEDKTFSEFVAAFKVGPAPREGRTAAAASVSRAGVSLDLEEKQRAAPDPLKMFFDSAAKTIAALRSLLPEITRASEEEPQQKLLADLCEKVQELKAAAVLPEVLPVWQMSAALEGLTKQLIEKNRHVTPSTLRTVASAIDLLGSLSTPGVKPDLVSNPPIRFLAVDDDSISRHAVSFALRKALNKPDLAENGEAALALASQIPYDAIFLDVQMPGMNGFETCSKIHATEVNRTTPIVFVTCQSDFDARAKSTVSGGNDLIGKPFLIFEITVKALTLAFRGRLQRRFGATAETVAKPSAEVLDVQPSPKDNRKPEEVNGSEPETNPGQTSESASAPKHKSRGERRRDRRRKVQAAREGKNRKGRHSRREEPASCLPGNNGNGEASEEGSSLDDDAVEASNSPADLSADAVANAFLAQAPRHIRDLRNHVEQINQAASEEIRQEMVINLYLAVHSLAAEAELAKLRSIFQTASTLEALLKTFVEDSNTSTASTLSLAATALELLDELSAQVKAADADEAPAEELAVTAK